MPAPYNPPKKNKDFKIGVALEDANNFGTFLDDPPIVAGDALVSKDFGAWANITTLPVVSPSGSPQVEVVLSSSEMNANVVSILLRDQTIPKAWNDFFLSIPTSRQ